MKNKQDKRLFKVKAITICLISTQLLLCFLPLNWIETTHLSVFQAVTKALNGAILYSADNIRAQTLFYLSTIAILINIFSFLGLFFTNNRKRYRGINLTFSLLTGVILAFCWGAMINISGLSKTFYGYNFLALILNISIIIIVLTLDENDIIKKEL